MPRKCQWMEEAGVPAMSVDKLPHHENVAPKRDLQDATVESDMKEPLPPPFHSPARSSSCWQKCSGDGLALYGTEPMARPFKRPISSARVWGYRGAFLSVQ